MRAKLLTCDLRFSVQQSLVLPTLLFVHNRSKAGRCGQSLDETKSVLPDVWKYAPVCVSTTAAIATQCKQLF